MKRCLTHFVGAALSAVLVLSGCNQTTKPSARTTVAAAGTFAVQPAAGGLNESDFRQLWMEVLPVDAGDHITRLIQEQDIVEAVTPRNVVFTLAKTNGILSFYNYVNGGGREIFAPVVTPLRIVYVGQSNLEVYNRRNGNFEKSIPLPFTMSSNGVADHDDLFLGADRNGGELVDINVSRTYVPVVWSLLTNGEVTGAPAFQRGTIYVGSQNGGIYAVSTDRTALWSLNEDRYDTGGEIRGDVKVDDAGVYVASTSGRVICINPNSGKLKWEYLAGRVLETGPVVTRTSVYESIPDIGLAAIDKSSPLLVDAPGKRSVQQQNRPARWICKDAAQFVAEDRAYVYVRTFGNELWALDRVSGDVRFRGRGTHFTSMATNITDDIIYAATTNGVVYAIKPELGPGSPGYIQ